MQQGATKLTPVEQLSLIPQPHKVISRPVSFDRIYQLTDVHQALLYGCELATLAPKQVYGPMGKDKTAWSRIVNGEWDLSTGDVYKFNRVVNNNALLMFLNHQDGVDLHSIRMSQDDKDREIKKLREELAEEKRERETLVKFFQEHSK